MTPCEKLGYKVGDRFEVVIDNGSSGIKMGDTVILHRDDGSAVPFFRVEGKEFDSDCIYLSSVRPIISLKLQTEAEKRGAKFGTMGVVKATGQKWVFSRQVGSLWRGISDSGVVIGGEPDNFRLDHEPEYKEIPFSEATDEQRRNAEHITGTNGEDVQEIYAFSNGAFGYTIKGSSRVFHETAVLTVRVPA